MAVISRNVTVEAPLNPTGAPENFEKSPKVMKCISIS
jgi:hypothetical protein